MKYNLTANVINGVGAITVLTEADLELLTDGRVAVGGISLTAGDEVVIVCDLLNRYHLDTIKYYYSGNGSVRVEVAESQGLWYDITPVSMSGGVVACVNSYCFRWARITHTITSSVVMYEVQIHNDNTNILFGYQGGFSSYGVDAEGIVVQAIPIYNASSAPKDINIFIENDDSIVADDLLMLGLTSSGIFYEKHERGVNFPSDFSWDFGQHNDTETTVSGHLTLSGTATSGTYYSPVFDTSAYDNNRFFWDHYTPPGSKIDYWQSRDSELCFGVRRFYIPPSGVWNSGALANESDYYWSISSGLLEFNPVPNHSILELRGYDYMQFVVTMVGTAFPCIYKAGVESALTLSGIQPSSHKDIFVTSVSGTSSGLQAGLMCWYKE